MVSDKNRFPLSNQESGEEFCRALVSATEFGPLLKKFGGKGSKTESVDHVVGRIMSGDVAHEDVVLEFCKLPRMWLCIATCDYFETSAQQGGAEAFLTDFGTGGWYGPFSESAEDEDKWWICAEPIIHEVLEASFGEERTYKKMAYRWHIIAHVQPRKDLEKCVVSLHWFGFNHDERGTNEAGGTGRPKSQQFDYWNHIPKLLGELPTIVAGTSLGRAEPVELHNLVLHELMDLYEGDPEKKWEHLKVRAESDGIAMNTTSSPAQGAEIEIAGIRQLTSTLATSSLKAMSLSAESDEAKLKQHSLVERALLRTLVREWGTRGYEFKMRWEEKQIRGYFFFGGQKLGPDQLTHIKTYKHDGWSSRTRDFVVSHLWP